MRTRLAAAAALALAACIPQHVTTEIAFVDPARVSLATGSAVVVVPDGADPVRGELASSSALRVIAQRDTDLGIGIVWTEIAPALPPDLTATLVDAHASIRLDDPAARVLSPDQLAAQRLELRWCASVIHHPAFKAIPASRQLAPHGCIAGEPSSSDVPYTLATPWTNARIVEHHRPDYAAAAVGIPAATLTFGTFGALMLAFPASSFDGGARTKYALAISDLALILAFDLPLLPVLFQRGYDVTIAPR